MIFKEIEYNNPNRTTDKYEEVPQEELWEDGTEEYLSDIPGYVAKNVDEHLTELEN